MVGWRQACKVFAETGLDTYHSICLLRDQIPRLMVISLSFVLCVTLAHLQVIPFDELERVSKIKRAAGPPKTGEFCICFAAVKIKADVSRLSELAITVVKSVHVHRKTK